MKTFVSLPHFHGADPFFIEQFKEGSLHPSSSKHSASITVQESTSIPTEVKFKSKELVKKYYFYQVLMRLQIILQLSPNPNLGTFFANLTPVLLPVLWFDAEASITEDIADQLKIVGKVPLICIKHSQVNLQFVGTMPTVAEILGAVSFLTGLGLLCLFIFKTYTRRKQMDTEPHETVSCIMSKNPKVVFQEKADPIK